MWKGLATARGVLEAGHTLVSTGRCCVAVTLFNRFWAQGQFPGPFVSVGLPSNNTIGGHAGLPVVGINNRNRA